MILIFWGVIVSLVVYFSSSVKPDDVSYSSCLPWVSIRCLLVSKIFILLFAIGCLCLDAANIVRGVSI